MSKLNDVVILDTAGMVHISKISKERINRVEDVLTLGDKVKVVCLGKDKMGRISFSMKDVPAEA